MDTELIKSLAYSNEQIKKIVESYEEKIRIVRRNAKKHEACLRSDLCEEIAAFLKKNGLKEPQSAKTKRGRGRPRKSQATITLSAPIDSGDETEIDDANDATESDGTTSSSQILLTKRKRKRKPKKDDDVDYEPEVPEKKERRSYQLKARQSNVDPKPSWMSPRMYRRSTTGDFPLHITCPGCNKGFRSKTTGDKIVPECAFYKHCIEECDDYRKLGRTHICDVCGHKFMKGRSHCNQKTRQFNVTPCVSPTKEAGDLVQATIAGAEKEAQQVAKKTIDISVALVPPSKEPNNNHQEPNTGVEQTIEIEVDHSAFHEGDSVLQRAIEETQLFTTPQNECNFASQILEHLANPNYSRGHPTPGYSAHIQESYGYVSNGHSSHGDPSRVNPLYGQPSQAIFLSATPSHAALSQATPSRINPSYGHSNIANSSYGHHANPSHGNSFHSNIPRPTPSHSIPSQAAPSTANPSRPWEAPAANGNSCLYSRMERPAWMPQKTFIASSKPVITQSTAFDACKGCGKLFKKAPKPQKHSSHELAYYIHCFEECEKFQALNLIQSCPECPYKFLNKNSFSNHLTWVHNIRKGDPQRPSTNNSKYSN